MLDANGRSFCFDKYTHSGYNKERNNAGEVVFEFPVPVLIQIDKDESLPDRLPAHIKLSGRDDMYMFEITVIKLFLQKKAPEAISEELGIPLEDATYILRESGMLG